MLTPELISGFVANIALYARRRDLSVGARLGLGTNGIVFKAESQSECLFSAIKCQRPSDTYRRERDAYLRLRDEEVIFINECMVPQLIGFDDELGIIEMTYVTSPFLLDFGSAFLDRDPGFSEDVLADWHAQKSEQFGPRWPKVQAMLRELETMGIFMTDVHPRNISWPD